MRGFQPVAVTRLWNATSLERGHFALSETIRRPAHRQRWHRRQRAPDDHDPDRELASHRSRRVRPDHRPRGTVVLDGSRSSDVDSDPLTYDWTLRSIPDGSTAVLSDPTLVAPQFVADLEGVYVAELVVNDGELSSPPDTVTIPVNPLPGIQLS